MSVMKFAQTEAGVIYHIRPLDTGARLFEIICRVREPDAEGQVVSLPSWIPGSYMIRDFARHVVSLEADCHGAAVPLRKLDKARWRAQPVPDELRLRAEVYASDLSVRGACLDARHGFFNGCCVFFRIHGREDERCVVHISPGDRTGTADWRVATGLTRLTGTSYDFGAFEASDYRDLIDHPVLMGELSIAEFESAGVPHAVAIIGRHQADLDRLRQDLQRLCNWQINFFRPPAPMSHYVFLVRLNGEGFGGLEHRASAALVCKPIHLPVSESATPAKDYRRFLGLASHEYFHLWNVKRIRPAEFVRPDLDREVYTKQLWIFEGITSYYDDLALLRSGLIPVPAYLELAGRTLTAVYRSPGRRRQSLEEASFDTWIKFYRPDENSPNVQVSYYAKGAMVALALDLEIRLRSAGRSSLDDVLRVLWENYGRNEDHGLPDGAFEELAGEVSGLDLSEFFRQNLRGTVDPPVGILLAQFGVRLHLRAAESAGDAGGLPGQREDRPRPWLGLRTRELQGRVQISHVLDGGPAQRAGIAANDEVVSVSGIRASMENFDQLLDRLQIGKAAEFHLFRHDELIAVAITPGDPPKDTCYLKLDEAADENAIARRHQWLGTGD